MFVFLNLLYYNNVFNVLGYYFHIIRGILSNDWPKKGDALSLLYINIQINNCGVKIDKTTFDVLGFAGDLYLLGDDKTINGNSKHNNAHISTKQK